MTYIPMPIVIPSSSGGDSTEYVYPFLPQFIMAVGGIGFLVGVCGIVICFLAELWGSDNPDLDLLDGLGKSRLIDVIVTKHRGGEPGEFEMMFMPASFQFAAPATSWAYQYEGEEEFKEG